EAFLRALHAKDPQHAAALYQLALLAERKGELEQAATYAQTCAALQPKSPLVAGLRGRLALRRGNEQEAIAPFSQAYDCAVARLRPASPEGSGPSAAAKMPALQPILYLPVEISSRELLSRLVLAHSAVNAGFIVVLLGHNVLRSAWRLPPGIIIHKGIN